MIWGKAKINGVDYENADRAYFNIFTRANEIYFKNKSINIYFNLIMLKGYAK